MEKDKEVKKEIREPFFNTSKEVNYSRAVLDGVDLKGLNIDDNGTLEAHFSNEKIKEAIWKCDDNKSLGQIIIVLLF